MVFSSTMKYLFNWRIYLTYGINDRYFNGEMLQLICCIRYQYCYIYGKYINFLLIHLQFISKFMSMYQQLFLLNYFTIYTKYFIFPSTWYWSNSISFFFFVLFVNGILKKWSLGGRNGKSNSQNIKQKDIMSGFYFNEIFIDVFLIEVKINFYF